MTNPVILLGTQSNGETLPVQVDATGRLVAEGLEGPPGPQGEQGPQGEPGPAGEGGGGGVKQVTHVQCSIDQGVTYVNVDIPETDITKAIIVTTGVGQSGLAVGDMRMTDQSWIIRFTSSTQVYCKTSRREGSGYLYFSVLEYL